MSISNLFAPNRFHLFGETMTATNITADKLFTNDLVIEEEDFVNLTIYNTLNVDSTIGNNISTTNLQTQNNITTSNITISGHTNTSTLIVSGATQTSSINNSGNINSSFFNLGSGVIQSVQVANELEVLSQVNLSCGTGSIVGDITIEDNLTINGFVLGTLDIASSVAIQNDLDVGANITCNRLYINGTNQNTYLDAEEITYDDPNGSPDKLSLFYINEAFGSFNALLQPYVIRPSVEYGGASPQNLIGLDSSRQCYTLNRSGGLGVQTLTLRFTIPNLTTGSFQVPPVDHYLVINKSTTGNTTISLQPNDDSGNIISGQLWALSTYKHYNSTGSLVGAGASTLSATGDAFPTLTGFKGFITIQTKSIIGPSGLGSLCFQSEAWEQP